MNHLAHLHHSLCPVHQPHYRHIHLNTTAPTTTPRSSTTPRHTAVKAAPKVRKEKSEKPRRPAPTAPPTPTTSAPSAHPDASTIQQDFATLGTTAQTLAESVRLLQAQQQQLILDSQHLQEQQQLQLRHAPPSTTSTSPTAPTPSQPTITPTPTLPTAPTPAAKARPIEPPTPHPKTSSTTAARPVRVP